ncbi:MAG: SsrA-binding protein SmpB [Candidatus Omnitrophota bacterium]
MAENIIVTNRRAKRDYEIIEALEAGIELKGTEIKSLRARRANLSDSFARVENNEIFIYNFHISPYEFGNINNVDPLRTRKLLLHKNQILRLLMKTRAKGYTLIPLKVYLKSGFAKVEIALARGRRQFDKREAIKEKEARLEIERSLRKKR